MTSSKIEIKIVGVDMPLQFDPSKHKNILECLESNGHSVMYQCRLGYCGSCRVKLCSGNLEYKEDPIAALNKNDMLPCICVPKSSVELRLT